jgi:hypothetical protein
MARFVVRPPTTFGLVFIQSDLLLAAVNSAPSGVKMALCILLISNDFRAV